MVKGLDIFRAHFQNFADRYVLIGGTACEFYGLLAQAARA